MKNLIQRHFEGGCQFLDGFKGWNAMTILDAAEVATKKAGPLFNVTLAEVLLLANLSEFFPYEHEETNSNVSLATTTIVRISTRGLAYEWTANDLFRPFRRSGEATWPLEVRRLKSLCEEPQIGMAAAKKDALVPLGKADATTDEDVRPLTQTVKLD